MENNVEEQIITAAEDVRVLDLRDKDDDSCFIKSSRHMTANGEVIIWTSNRDDSIVKLPSYMLRDGRVIVVMSVSDHSEVNKILEAKIKARTRYRDAKREGGSRAARRTKDIALGQIDPNRIITTII